MPSFNDFYFNSSTGKNRIHVRRCVPDGQVRAVVQIMHGIAEHISRYDDFMAFLASNGFVAVGTDHLGHGQSIEKPEQMGFFAEKNGWDYIIKDEEILRLAMKQTYPNVPFVLFGHSMGSFMARTHLIRYPGGFDAAIISGTGNQSRLSRARIITASSSITSPSEAIIRYMKIRAPSMIGSRATLTLLINTLPIRFAALYRHAACSGI